MVPFIFSEGAWLGQGIITLSTSPEEIKYYTKWLVQSELNHTIYCTQIVEREGVRENLLNNFTFYNMTETGFEVILESEELGKVKGSGSKDGNSIAWEFNDKVPFEGSLGFQGFEIYTFLDIDQYKVHAEYYLENEYRTFINGKIWRKI